MENPRTWTPLHHEIRKILAQFKDLNDPELVNALFDFLSIKNDITKEQIKDVVDKFSEMMKNRICGLSFQSLLINNLNLK